MRILLVAVAFATLVGSPVLAQSQTGDGCDPYFGTYWDDVAPYSGDSCTRPLRWDHLGRRGALLGTRRRIVRSYTVACRAFAVAATVSATRVRFVRGNCMPTKGRG
jgi:hypothetical protein